MRSKKFVTRGPGMGLVPMDHLTFFAKEDGLGRVPRPSLAPQGVEASPSGLLERWANLYASL